MSSTRKLIVRTISHVVYEGREYPPGSTLEVDEATAGRWSKAGSLEDPRKSVAAEEAIADLERVRAISATQEVEIQRLRARLDTAETELSKLRESAKLHKTSSNYESQLATRVEALSADLARATTTIERRDARIAELELRLGESEKRAALQKREADALLAELRSIRSVSLEAATMAVRDPHLVSPSTALDPIPED